MILSLRVVCDACLHFETIILITTSELPYNVPVLSTDLKFIKAMSRSWIYPRVIAHRGGGKIAPENTLLAIKTGFDLGYRAVEFDVMLSEDEVPMLMHDEVLGRTLSNSFKSQYDGLSFNKFSAMELIEIEVDNKISPDSVCNRVDTIVSSKIPSFESVIQYCQAHSIWMNIEIKPASGFDFLTGVKVAEMTARYFPVNYNGDCPQPLFSSFSFVSLQAARDTAIHIPRGYLLEDPIRLVPEWRKSVDELKAISIHLNHESLTEAEVKEIKTEGFGIMCWTVNDVERSQELLRWGIDSFCTDELFDFQKTI